MTREEAKEILTELWGVYNQDYLTDKESEAVEMAIEALQEPENITLTYDEQCIFLAAMRRERWICQEMDEYEDSETKVKPLVPSVDEIERKVKAVLCGENNG